jgi:ABC-type nitrate/sulfonate/bicarbonate transport system substrate-binding protein
MPLDTVWYTRCPIPTAFSLIMHNGALSSLLSRHGLRLGSIRHAPDLSFRISHFRHDLPGMLRHGGHIPPLWSRAEGRDVRLLGLSWTNESQLILTLPGSGIKTLADLKGRRLALPIRPNYPIDFWRATVLKGLSDALKIPGLSLEDVEIVAIENLQAPFAETNRSSGEAPPGTAAMTFGSQRPEAHALIRGEVDAIFAPGHYGTALKHFLGATVVADLTQELPRAERVNNPSLLAFTAEGRLVDEQPELVAALMAEVLEGAAFAEANKDFARRTVAAESGNPEECVEEIFGPDFNLGLAPSLDEEILAAFERQTAFLHRNGFLPREVPLAEWLTPGPLTHALSSRTKIGG